MVDRVDKYLETSLFQFEMSGADTLTPPLDVLTALQMGLKSFQGLPLAVGTHTSGHAFESSGTSFQQGIRDWKEACRDSLRLVCNVHVYTLPRSSP